MSIEQAIITQARPYVLAQKAKEIILREADKGCSSDIVDQPVSLEPVYQSMSSLQDLFSAEPTVPWTLSEPPLPTDLVRLHVWQSPEQSCDWLRSELFIKQLSCLRNPVALEVLGNSERISVHLLCHRSDQPVVRAAFAGQFEQCVLSEVSRGTFLESILPAAWAGAAFYDFYPPGPYSHLFTSPEEIKRSPFSTLTACLAGISRPTLGFYQAIFQAVAPDHDWHGNVKFLLDLEYRIKQMADAGGGSRYPQQPPSAALNPMSGQVETKAHNDKPFFSAALRIAVVDGGDQAEPILRSLATVCSLVQHGGRPWNVLTADDYRASLLADRIGLMFTRALTFRPGFLANSKELSSLVHLPPPDITEHLRLTFPKLETLPSVEALSAGTQIGYCDYANIRMPVCIPPDIRGRHTHLIGRNGVGKSTAVEHMVLDDIRRGQGVAVLDPHGRLVERLLRLIGPDSVDKVVYLNPGDQEWVPIWNPLRRSTPVSPDRIADDLVAAFRSFVLGWGDRMEHLLRHSLLATLHLPDGNLRDVLDLLRQKSPQSAQLIARVLEVVDNEVAREFWQHDFPKYRPADITPAHHKLGKLLTAGTYSYMLSQSESAFDLRDIMDTGKILLVDLSTIGSEVREVLGCFMLSLLHLTALGRNSAEDETLQPYHIFVDEAHRFMTDAMEDLVAETRKFKVSLTLAHQCMSQFTNRKGNMLSGVGTTIIYNVNTADAQYLRRDLQGLVDEDDLITLEVGQAIARIGTHVVRLRTPPPLPIPAQNCRDLIVQQSRQRYYRPIQEVRRAISRRNDRWAEPILGRYQGGDLGGESVSPATAASAAEQERCYDTF
jgi:hypothetical protein